MNRVSVSDFRLETGLLDHPRVMELLEGHLQHMRQNSPAESVHALAATGLEADDITFWSLWDGQEVLGCVALRQLSDVHGELKSMKTNPIHTGRGVGTALLMHVLEVCAQRAYRRLSLETGSGPAFEPAHSLYLKFGFQFCEPFGDYTEDPFSRCMTIEIEA